MNDDIRAIFEAVRGDCPPAIWSQGISLSRSATVAISPDSDDDEIIVTVKTPVAILARTVTLMIDDEDWMCDCSPRDEVCEHVVAAVIALQRADEEGTSLVAKAPVHATVGYRLRRNGGGLGLFRVVVHDGDESPLRGSVGAAAMSSKGAPVVARPVDLEVERRIGYRDLKWVPPGQMVGLLKTLATIDDVLLDDGPVEISTREVGLNIRVSDRQGDFWLQVEQDKAITEIFNNGVALCGKVLRPVGQSGLTARELEDYREGVRYAGHQVSDLVSNVLPGLRKRVAVVVDSNRLPVLTSEPARVLVDARTEGHELVVLPAIVYGDPPIARVDGGRLILLGKKVPERDHAEERRLGRRLESQLGLKPGHRATYSGEQAVAFASRLARWHGGDISGDPLDTFHVAPPLGVTLDVTDESFDALFETEVDGRKARAGAGTVVQAWRSGASLVPLEGGGWAPLPTDWLRKHGEVLSDLLAAREAAGKLPPSALPDVARLCQALDQPPPPRFQRLRALFEGFEALPEPALPADLTATLRDYQRRGVRWMSFLRRTGLGAMLADDMGLGKTLQAMCTFEGRVLVVAPTSVLPNWRAELNRFRPSLRVCTYHGPRRELDPDADVTITTYALMRMDVSLLSATRWDTVVLDEAQAIKNPSSQVARAAFQLDARWRLTLTGTPVENRLDELWSQLHFLNPGLLGGRSDFEERYAKPIADGDPQMGARLRERIRPFVLRRLKREVAPELPPRTEQVLYCELSEGERAVYDAIRAATRDELVQRLQAGGSVMEALEALLRLRQAASHRGLIPGQEADDSAKVGVLLEKLEEIVAEGHKALVFSQWTGLLDRIEPHLDKANVAFTRLDGSTRDRQGVVEAFQADGGPPVMLISLKAGGTGLNLTAADHVFLMDPWWNPAVEDQAADRAHRIGQDRPVFVHRLVATDTVEERILALQEHKRALAEAALGEAGRAVSLTRDDLLALLA